MTVNISKPAVNVREKLAELDKPTGIAGEAMLRAETPQEQFNLIGAGRRNLLINGGFDVWQRGTNVAQSSSDSYGNYLSADRWATYYNGTGIQRVTQTYGGQYGYAARIYSSAGQPIYTYQKIEGGSALLSGQTITYSFWARANKSTKISGANMARFYDSGAFTTDQHDLINHDGHNISTDWQKITYTTKIPDDTYGPSHNRDFFFVIYVDTNVSANDWIEIAQVQLEVGKVATPFEHRSYGEELALCQRYYQRLTAATNNAAVCTTSLWTGGTSCYGVLHLPTELRTAPTVSYSGTFVVYSGGSTVNVISSGGGSNFNGNSVEVVFNHSAIGSAGNSAWVRMGSTGNYVGLDAEL